MMDNFMRTTVAELVRAGEIHLQTGPFGTQLKASDYTERGVPVINVRNIGLGRTKPEKLEYITLETCNRLSAHVLCAGDIVLGRKGAVERHALIQKSEAGWLQGSDCIRMRISSSRIDPAYVSYCFQTERHKDWMMNQCSHGATMASLNQAILERIVLPLPAMAEQQRIASILSTYDDLIENCQRRIRILEVMARGLYREWFVHFRYPGHEPTLLGAIPPGCVPSGWEIQRLGDLAQEMRRNVPKGQLEEPRPYVGLEHIPRRSLALNDWETSGELGSNKLEFKKGEVLFGKIRPYFHKVCVAPFDGLCSADTIVIRAKQPEKSALVTACVSTDEFVAHATASSNGSKMPRANWSVLAEYPVVVPDSESLRRFTAVFDAAVSQQQTLVKQVRNLRATRDLLLPRLLSGEVAG